MQAYRSQSERERFSLFRKNTWGDGRIDSLEGLIKHAYSEGKRTKLTLINLGWVKEATNGTLEPDKKAPCDFEEALKDYNNDAVNLSQGMKKT